MWRFNLLLNNFVLGLWSHVIFLFVYVFLCYSFSRLLPPQFPQEKPVISVYPPIRHHLMDSQGLYVTSPLVSNVRMCYSLFQSNITYLLYYSFFLYYSWNTKCTDIFILKLVILNFPGEYLILWLEVFGYNVVG